MNSTRRTTRRIDSTPRGLHPLALAIGLACFGLQVSAQDAPPDQDAEQATEDERGLNLDQVVVTATALPISKMRASNSVSTLGVEAIGESAPRSTAEIFRNLPGVRSESTGGEGNANIAVRGLPVAAGGAKFLQLHEDGLPVMEFGDIAFGNADIFLRADATLDRIEVVRGGSASTFASNSPGGVINLISKTGEYAGGSVALSYGLGYDNLRTDFEYGAPVGDGWNFHIGGFWRQGEGVRRAGYDGESGGQIKGNLTRQFEQGYARVYFKRLDDRAIGYLPMPVRASGRNSDPDLGSLPGFDPRSDTPHSAFFLSNLGLDGENNRRRSDIADGMRPQSTAFGAEFAFDIGDGWSVLNRFRIADNSGRFISPFPAEASSAAALAQSIGGAGARLVYANGPQAGQTFSGQALRIHLFDVEINDFGNAQNDLQLTRAFALGSGEASLKGGLYVSRQSIDMDWLWNSYALELKGDNAALLNVIGANGTVFSQGGLYAYGVPFWGNCCTRSYDTDYSVEAPYLAFTHSLGAWDFDLSLRRDSGKARGSYAGSVQRENFDVDGNGVISANERSVSVISAVRQPVNYDWRYTSYSAGANYLFNEDLGAFARISRGGRANADRLLFGVVSADGSVRSQDAIDLVDQLEFGLKYRSGPLNLFVTAFRAETEEQNFEATSQRFLDRVYTANGVEFEAAWYSGPIALSGGLTLTDAEISRDAITPQFEGNRPRRQARAIYQFTGSYAGERWLAGLNLIGTTDAYAQDNNVLVMPGYTQVNLFGEYELRDGLSVGLGVNNLFDTLGLTEVEEGAIIEGQENILRARSINGRTANLVLRYAF